MNRSLGRFLTTARFFSSASGKASAADVNAIKKLRELSGAPMMDCKNALSAADVGGDLQKALAWLRAKGIAKAAQSTRVTKEGLIGVHVNDALGTATLIEVNCETDFVSINKDFQQFVATVAETISAQAGTQSRNLVVSDVLKYTQVPAVESKKSFTNLQEAFGDVVASIRETIVLKRASVISLGEFHNRGGVFAAYVHNKVNGSTNPNTQLGKAVAVVSMVSTPAQSSSAVLRDQAGRKLAMHIVAAKPLYLNPAQVPQSFLDQENAIFAEQAQAAEESATKKKTPEMLQKVIAGKVQKRLAEVCLLQQQHLAEEGNPVVQKHLDALGASLGSKVSVTEFALWALQQE